MPEYCQLKRHRERAALDYLGVSICDGCWAWLMDEEHPERERQFRRRFKLPEQVAVAADDAAEKGAGEMAGRPKNAVEWFDNPGQAIERAKEFGEPWRAYQAEWDDKCFYVVCKTRGSGLAAVAEEAGMVLTAVSGPSARKVDKMLDGMSDAEKQLLLEKLQG